MGLSFGIDRGPIKVYGLSAAHHCEVMLDGVYMGQLYGLEGGRFYEYRGKGIGAEQLEWFGSGNKAEVIKRLNQSVVSAQNEVSLQACDDQWL